MVKVSVIMPVWNQREKFLREAIESVLDQTINKDDFELIVVDDGSKDYVEEVCKSYGDKLKYIRKDHTGIPQTLNIGIKEAKGEFFAWCSSDDLWMPRKLELQIKTYKKAPKDSVLYTDYYMINEEGESMLRYKCPRFDDFDDFCVNIWQAAKRNQMHINFSTIFIPMKLVRENFFWEGITYGEDLEWLLRMVIVKHYKFFLIPEALIKYRVSDNTVTNKKLKEIPKNNEKIFKRINKMLMEAKNGK